MYVLRSSSTFNHGDMLCEIVRSSVEKLFSCIISDQTFSQVTLSTSFSEHGLLSVNGLSSSSSFISSVLRTATLRNSILPGNTSLDTSFLDATRLWNMLIQKELSNKDVSNSQGHWLKPIFERQFNRLVDTVNNHTDFARLFGCRAQRSGEWLDVIPLRNLGFTISDDEFRVAAGLRIGAPVSARANVASGHPLTENMHK